MEDFASNSCGSLILVWASKPSAKCSRFTRRRMTGVHDWQACARFVASVSPFTPLLVCEIVFGSHLRSFVTTTRPKPSLIHSLKSAPLVLTGNNQNGPFIFPLAANLAQAAAERHSPY